ncbi:putative ankyrin repeat-containing protein [Rosellinia necatrix]|uniref:Putative ankyrin repeat-containing protein n=1 Tax=Rosellinia necatrix TaxID=77044 RepID=A0A1W2TE09_ROSNE|nr:putative ankyrin repeat-containing protein [Rosellinia necatrix]
MAETHDTISQRAISAGAVTAADNARVHVGDQFYLAPAGNPKVRSDFLRGLFTSPYRDRKDRNPKRADGTCEWFTSHRLFQNWRGDTSALLWVSADPGCGKSVLARYLIDDVFPSTATRTTCYFFFKDDFDDQRVLEGALCCILHQLFTQQPELLSDEILEGFEEDGDQLFKSFHRLWDILTGVAQKHKGDEIICLLDALDECIDHTRLARALTQHYSNGKGISTLKFLVTSRPYLRVQRGFERLERSQPTIHLSGDGQEEKDKIAREITIVINQRIEELCERLGLSTEEKHILHDKLSAVSHRTYLWVYLVFAALDDTPILTKHHLRTVLRQLPLTVEQAYDSILSKSRDANKAKEILQIIVVADRPLQLPEMATVLAIRGESPRCHDDLKRDLIPPDRLQSEIRETCGLFITIQNSQVFLLHQTAREFLVHSPDLPCSFSLKWQYSINLQESHRLLSEICMKYLLLDDFMKPARKNEPQKSDDGYDFDFLGYAASNWADHYRQARNTQGTDLEHSASRLCDTNSPACSHWLKVYGETRMQDSDFPDELPTPLLIASYFGLDNLVDLILKEDKKSIDIIGASGQRTALSWASEKGYDLIVKSLLRLVPRYRVFLKDKLQSKYLTIVNRKDGLGRSPLWYSAANGHSPTIVNRKDGLGRSPLWYSAANGHKSIVQHLLKGGAKVDARDKAGLTPLAWATHHGHSDIVALLLENGARPRPKSLETRDQSERTPLIIAALNGDETLVKLLLDYGAKVEALDDDGCTALIKASSEGHEAVVKLLLDSGAQVDILDSNGDTALITASSRGHEAVVRLLLDSGADVDISDSNGGTALIMASVCGHEAVVKLLLNSGAEVDISDGDGGTALIKASSQGHEAVVKLLLDSGADVDISSNGGYTALIMASFCGHEAVVKLLLNSSAKVDISDGDGYTALITASARGHKAVVKLLLNSGAKVDISDGDGDTALITASARGHKAVVKLLLDSGADVDISNHNGDTALSLAKRKEYHGIIELLQSKGA